MSSQTEWRLTRVMLIGLAVGLVLGFVQLAIGTADIASSGNEARDAGQMIGYPFGAAIAMALLFGLVGLIRNTFAR